MDNFKKKLKENDHFIENSMVRNLGATASKSVLINEMCCKGTEL